MLVFFFFSFHQSLLSHRRNGKYHTGGIIQVDVYNLENLTCRWEFYHVGIHLSS